MLSTLSHEDLAALATLLQQRRTALRDTITAELLATENGCYRQLAGKGPNRGDASVANLLVDVDRALVNLPIEELLDIEAAQQRMHDGIYGCCCACGSGINFARLYAYPSAKRCRKCQEKVERLRGQETVPRL